MNYGSIWKISMVSHSSFQFLSIISSVSKEDYLDACKKCGWDLSLDEFAEEFNADGNYAPTNQYHFIRFY